jgi:hypothetical protein
MRKMFLFAMACISIVSCKKEAVEPSQPATQNVSMKQQVSDLIQKTDTDLYNQLYNPSITGKKPRPIVKAIPGIFYIPGGGIDDATCWPSFNVCMIIIIEKRSPQIVTGPEAELFINGTYDETFPEDVIAKLIINRPVPEIRFIHEIHATKDDEQVIHLQYH